MNHFWRLLNDLDIPYITLLDFDREREGGGWGRIKYVLEQLIQNGYPKSELLKTESGCLSDEEFGDMHTWDVNNSDSLQSSLPVQKGLAEAKLSCAGRRGR